MLNMLDDKKKMASVIIDGMGEPEGGSDFDTAMDHASHKLILSVDKKDVKGVCEAFKTLFDLCDSQHHEEYGEGEEEGEDSGMEYK